VPTKVNLEGGEINIGDRITLSSVAGVGKKATPFEDSVGIAIQPFNSKSKSDRIEVFINLSYGIDIDTIGKGLLDTPAKSADKSAPTSFAGEFLKNLFARVIEWFADTANGIGDFFAKIIHTDKLCIGKTCVTESELKQLLDLRNELFGAQNTSR